MKLKELIAGFIWYCCPFVRLTYTAEVAQLEAKNAALRLAANSLLGLIDCLGGGRDLDDAGPDRKQLAELVDYPKGIEAIGDETCNYYKRTPDEAKGGYKCSTCGRGGE